MDSGKVMVLDPENRTSGEAMHCEKRIHGIIEITFKLETQKSWR